MSDVHTIERNERSKALDQFAQAPAIQAPSVQPLAAPQDRVFGAQAVAVYRDEARILQKLQALGAAAGSDWFYRFPVQNRRENRTDWIEGASIKLANDVARIYGNCDVDVRVIDLGENWLFYARFTDFETGYSLTRPFQQQKGSGKIGGGDNARRLDMAFQIGASKAIRNVVVNALQTFSDYAFEAARNSLIDKIGKDIKAWTERTVQGVKNLGVDLTRVETVVGRASKDWTAPDVAKIIAMMKAIADGMATVDETFPPKDKHIDREDGEGEGQAATGATSNSNSQPETAKGGETTAGSSTATGSDPDKSSGDPANSNSTASQQTSTSDAGQPASNKSEPPKDNGKKGAGKASEGDPEQTVPTTEAQYVGYANGWRDELTSSSEGEKRWKDEKPLRNKCNVGPDTREELSEKLNAKVAELKAAGK